jgi:hypothetical protein
VHAPDRHTEHEGLSMETFRTAFVIGMLCGARFRREIGHRVRLRDLPLLLMLAMHSYGRGCDLMNGGHSHAESPRAN